jgi:WD40 repeat protein
MVGKGHGNQINAMHIQGNNLVTAAMDDTVRITPLGSRQYSGDAIKLDSTPVDIAVGKRDQLIVAAITDSIVIIKNGKVSKKHAVKYQPSAIALSVDETKIAVGGKDNAVYIYNLSGDNISETAVLKQHRGAISSVTFSPDGQLLASSDTNREIFVFETKSNQVKVSGWVFHTARVNKLAWTSDSLHLASAGLDGHLYVWDIQKPDKRIHIKDAHRGGANTVFWVDDHTVASAGQDCTIKTFTVNFH